MFKMNNSYALMYSISSLKYLSKRMLLFWSDRRQILFLDKGLKYQKQEHQCAFIVQRTQIQHSYKK